MCAETSRDDRKISSSVPRAWLPAAPRGSPHCLPFCPRHPVAPIGMCCSGTVPQPRCLPRAATFPALPACCPGQGDVPQVPTHRAQLLGRSRARWVCVGQRGRSWADGALWRWEQSPSPVPGSGHLTHPTQLSPRRARSRGLESQGPARSPQRSPKALGAHGLGAVPGALPIFCFLTRFSARPE